MKKNMRVFLTVCGIVIGVGLILGIAGLALGGIQGLAGVEARVPWISFGGGGTAEESLDVGAFRSVDLESDLTDVEFVEGKTFAVEMSYNKKDGAPRVEVKNETLTIAPGAGKRVWFNFDFFGSNTKTKLKIYYPKGTQFDRLKIENDMGSVTVADIIAKQIEFSTDTGYLELENVKADYMKLDVDMGVIKGRKISTKTRMEAELATGSLDLSGSLAGSIRVSCDMGDCVLTTDVPRKSCSFEVENDMGSCTIDKKQVEGNYTEINHNAKAQFDLELDTGNAEIRFQ